MINIKKRGENLLWNEWHPGTCLGSTVLQMPRAMITHLLAALELRLLALINNIQVRHLLLKIPC